MSNDALNGATIVDFVLDLFARRGAEEYMGERVSMAEHMEQTAACARADNAPEPLIAAALLHDVGHFVSDFALDALENDINNYHEEAGASFLARYFPSSVTEPVRLHVPAKRYLCAVEPPYFDSLSAPSVQSLKIQGGPMTPAQVSEFEANPWYRDAVRVRRYDDDGKVAGLTIRPVTSYRDLLESLLTDEPRTGGPAPGTS